MGGVVESHREGEENVFKARERVIKRLGNKEIEDEEINDRYQEINKRTTIGAINEMDKIYEWYEKIKKEIGFYVDFNEFVKVYEEEFNKIYYYKDVVNFITSLEGKCSLGVLSNLLYIDRNRINKHMNLKRFNYVWLSFELGCRKPEAKIYKIVEKECGFETNNILFIDDDKDNILMAKKRGWNVCRACGYELDKIKSAVYKFLDM